MIARRLLLLATLIGCTADRDTRDESAGLVTTFDHSGDTIVARVDGQVPVPALRTVTLVMRIAPAADDTSLFSEIGEFDVDIANRIWVYDYQARRLFLFDSSGTLIRRIGRQGAGPGEFLQGNGMVATADTGIAFLDSQNARVSFFDVNGDFRRSVPVPAGFSTGNGLVTDRSHALYLRRPVTPAREGEILGRMGLVRLNFDGTFADSLLPADLKVPRDTYIAVSPDGRGRSSTSSSNAPNYYWDWHRDGFFVTGDGGRYEIIIERKDGKPIVIRRNAPPVSVLPEEREVEKEGIIWNMRQTQPGWSWSGPDIPDTKAPMTGILVARDGNIWVRVATPSERIPDSDMPPQGVNGPPVRRFRSFNTYEVFSVVGEFLGRVPLPPKTTLTQAHGDYLWGIARDKDDLPSIVRFRLGKSFWSIPPG
jgi:hypothetical protein